ncbi:MAG: hypothetical protein QXG39_04870 [Candidatus Aenigmatarchaeota archaeon]
MLNLVTEKMVSGFEEKRKKKEKSLKDMLIDSLIVAMITAFSVWTGEPTLEQLLTILKSTGLAFFIQLAYYRGIKKVR